MKNRFIPVVAGLVAVGALAPAATAAVSAQLVQVAIGAGAKTADPNLNNFTSYDLRVTVTGPNAAGTAPADWTGTDLRALLTAGAFYVPAAGNGNTANSTFWPLAPNLEFDTFVTAPNFGATTVLGRFQPPGGAGTETFSASDVNVSYGDLVNTGNGTFTIARLTVSNGATGTVTGNVFDSFGGNAPTPFTATIPVPEPASTAVAAAAVALLAGRRRRRA